MFIGIVTTLKLGAYKKTTLELGMRKLKKNKGKGQKKNLGAI